MLNMFLIAKELDTALIAALVGLISTIVGLTIAILKNERLRSAIVNRLIGGVKGGLIVSVDDLNRHDIIVKIKTILSSGEHNSFSLIDDIERRRLFKRYMEIVCNIYLESVRYMLKQDFTNFDEQEIKLLIIGQMAWRRTEISTRLKAELTSINNDQNRAQLVADKLEEWRTYQCKLIHSNVINTISSGRFLSVEYKLDIILHQYSMGLDIIVSKGADSFVKLNGDLDAFLNE